VFTSREKQVSYLKMFLDVSSLEVAPSSPRKACLTPELYSHGLSFPLRVSRHLNCEDETETSGRPVVARLLLRVVRVLELRNNIIVPALIMRGRMRTFTLLLLNWRVSYSVFVLLNGK
jgi:hypothetical protein